MTSVGNSDLGPVSFEYYQNLYADYPLDNVSTWRSLQYDVIELLGKGETEVALQIATRLFKSIDDSHRQPQDAAYSAIVEEFTDKGEVKRAIDVAFRCLNKSDQFCRIVDVLVEKKLPLEALKIVETYSGEFDKQKRSYSLFLIARRLSKDPKTREQAVALACDKSIIPLYRAWILLDVTFDDGVTSDYIKENNFEAAKALTKIEGLSEFEISKILSKIVFGLKKLGRNEEAVEIRNQIPDKNIREGITIRCKPPAPPAPFPKLPTINKDSSTQPTLNMQTENKVTNSVAVAAFSELGRNRDQSLIHEEFRASRRREVVVRRQNREINRTLCSRMMSNPLNVIYDALMWINPCK